MSKSLVIVESPAKAKTINKYLGKDFVVKSSVGHIRDLPVSGGGTVVDPKKRAAEAAATRKLPPAKKAAHKKKKAKEQLVRRMGVDPEKGWRANYQILPGKEKVVAELKKLAKNAPEIYLATDMDREGEAIAWHLQQAIGGDESRYRRVVFNEITERAIQDAFKEPGEVDMARVEAQQARRFLDRVVGYMVSPLLWAKIARGLSAGRVQSVAVKLCVEREREIRAFVPEEYWEVFADLSREGQRAEFQVARQAGKAFRPTSGEATDAVLSALKDTPFMVSAREDKPTESKPNPPFITSTLQQAASTRMSFGVKKTMALAQRLYEAGLITYMRTDSTNLSQDAIGMARHFIGQSYGDAYLPESPRLYASKEAAQEAHEAIRPTDVRVGATQLSGQEADAVRLYELIWRQFVACQMTNAKYTSTSITVSALEYELRTRGRILRFDGFTRVQPPAGQSSDDPVLPDFKVNDNLRLEQLTPKQHFTKPPARYGEASLVRELEKKEIGRPSTFAAIISTIQDRGYVSLKNRRFYAEKIGELVTDRLNECFPNLLDYGFTASLEQELDQISKGEVEWLRTLNDFYGDFSARLDQAADEENGMRANRPSLIERACPTCERPMNVRTGSTGVFLGCSGYDLPPKERCKQTVNLIPGDEVVSANADDEAESRILMKKRRCSECNSAMTEYLLDEHTKLHLCGNNPDCAAFAFEDGAFKIKGYEGPTIACDKCGSEMQLKTGRFGKYFGCTGKVDEEPCKNTRKLLRNGEAAPPKMDPVPMPELQCEKVEDTYLLRDGAAGLFLAASQFPKNRETRAPYVDELIPHQNEIDPKYQFLMKAPVSDPDGRRSLVKFSRIEKQHYVASEIDRGKASGWRADYDESAGLWVEKVTTKSKAAPKRKRNTSMRKQSA